MNPAQCSGDALSTYHLTGMDIAVLNALSLIQPPTLTEFTAREAEELKKELIEEPLKRMAKLAETRFIEGTFQINSPEATAFIADGFARIFTDLAKMTIPSIVACDVNEAAFTHARSLRPIVATDMLATCIGLTGYIQERTCGFLMHIAGEEELQNTQELLTRKIKQISKGHKISFHMRGGVTGISEPLVQALDTYIQNVFGEVATKEVCLVPLLNDEGKPNTASISLDTRTGEISTFRSTPKETSIRAAILFSKPAIKIIYEKEEP